MKQYLPLIFFLLFSFGARSQDDRPNVVFIMSDDHAVSAVSAYNDWLSELAPTPNIDRIAKEGMLMHATYNTNSICGPSRACLLYTSPSPRDLSTSRMPSSA